MEPCGFVHGLRYGPRIHGRVGKRLRKRHRPPVAVLHEGHGTIPPMDRIAPGRSVALLLSIALIAAACGTSAPSPSTAPSSTPPRTFAPTPTVAPSPTAAPSGAADAIFDTIEAQVLALRGLQPADVERETIDEEALRALSAADFDKDNPADYVAANERLYKALGLLPEGDTLKGLFLELVGSQVAGFYRPDADKLYVVSRGGAVNGADKITFAHEYDHALQDANFDVFSDPEALRDQTDEALARAAVYEGDATLLMSYWAIPNLTPAELQEVVAAGSDPEATAILERTPRILTESLLFPYNTGLLFVQPIQTAGGWTAVDALYARLPRSTEQVLHPDKYDAGEAPIAVALPSDLAARMGEGWSVAFEDTWGEFQTGVWLREAGVTAEVANEAAVGWGGDRLAVLSGPDGAWAVVLDTVWDTDADAVAFLDGAQVAVNGLADAADIVADGDRGVTIMIASDQAGLLGLDKIFGATGS